MSNPTPSSRRLAAGLAAFLALAAPEAFAQRGEPSLLPFEVGAREALLVPDALRGTLEDAARAHAVRLENEKGAFLGLATVVDETGFLAAKAGDLNGYSNLFARVFGGKAKAIARRAGYDAANDLLLLKANLPGLKPPVVATNEPAMGAFVFAPDGEKTLRLRGGMISARARAVEKREGMMGVSMARGTPGGDGVRIAEVLKESGAEEAGLRAGDLLLSIAGTAVATQEEVRAIVFKHDAGERLAVRYRRNGEDHDAEVRLKHPSTITGMLFDRNQLMSGETSRRKTGFTRILQNELTLNRRAMGGPLLDAEGRVVGVNIARVNRVENYTLPWSLVAESAARLRDEIRDAR